MNVPDDFELLERYARGRSQQAFAELVRRHVDLVYSAALRQVRDPGTAEDVTQTVFVLLASRAATIRPQTILAGWLLNTAHFAARDTRRAAGRRRRHEQAAARRKAAQMNHPTPPADHVLNSDERSRLEALLDALLARLGAAGRDALVLRFFEQNSFLEVGRRLGITEEAAKKRVARSLQRLRQLLLRQGMTIGTEGLGSFLGVAAVRKAPPTVAAKVGQSALAAAPAPFTKGVLTIMAWTKAKTAAGVAAALLLIGGGAAGIGWYARHTGDSVTIAGPAGPLPSGVQFTWRVPPTTVVADYHGAPIAGRVVTREGTPVSGATVMLSTAAAPAILNASRLEKPVPTTRTGADGRQAVDFARRGDSTLGADRGDGARRLGTAGGDGDRVFV